MMRTVDLFLCISQYLQATVCHLLARCLLFCVSEFSVCLGVEIWRHVMYVWFRNWEFLILPTLKSVCTENLRALPVNTYEVRINQFICIASGIMLFHTVLPACTYFRQEAFFLLLDIFAYVFLCFLGEKVEGITRSHPLGPCPDLQCDVISVSKMVVGFLTIFFFVKNETQRIQ